MRGVKFAPILISVALNRSPQHALLVPSTFWQFSLESKLDMAAISNSCNDEIIAALNVIEDTTRRMNSLGDPDCVD